MAKLLIFAMLVIFALTVATAFSVNSESELVEASEQEVSCIANWAQVSIQFLNLHSIFFIRFFALDFFHYIF